MLFLLLGPLTSNLEVCLFARLNIASDSFRRSNGKVMEDIRLFSGQYHIGGPV